MNLLEFKHKKKEIHIQLKILLNEAKIHQVYGQTHFRECLLKDRIVGLTVRNNYKYLENDLKKFMSYKKSFPNVKMHSVAISKKVFCQNTFIGTKYLFIHKVLIDEIPESLVKNKMKRFVISKMGLPLHAKLDCQVMQFFKEGKITWKDAKEAHIKGCSI